MTRDLNSDQVNQLLAKAHRPALFMSGGFASGPVYLWTGVGTIDWNGVTWTGAGGMVSLSALPEGLDAVPQSMTVTMSGLSSELIAKVLEELRHGQKGRLWFAELAEDRSLAIDPIPIFAGLIDQAIPVESIDNPTIEISYINRLADLERPRLRFYTPEDQQARFPGDRGFDYVASIQEFNGLWGG